MNIVRPVCKFLRRNGPLLLTITATAGVAVTSYFTGKAVLKADKMLNEIPEEDFKTFATKKLIAKTYIPPVVSGVATIACIIGAHLMNKQIQAGLFAAYGLAQSTFEMYRRKLDPEDDERIMRELRMDRVNIEIQKLIDERPGEEYELWIDDYREHPYWATKSDILLGKDDLNACLNGETYNPRYNFRTSLEVFYSHVKGQPEPQDSIYGWDVEQLLEECETDHINIWWEDDIYIIPILEKQIPVNHIHFDWGPVENYWNYKSPWEKIESKDSRN